MKVTKRKANGVATTNGHGKKKTKIIEENQEDLQTSYFESEIAFHSTVTKMKVIVE